MEAKMYKIMLVEDEITIRGNIKRSIPWEKYGFIFWGEASNGLQALNIIEDEQPDVVITDIKMPFMDGIELSKILRSMYPRIKIIILSGYMEFTYAKEAISIGVYEYVLKPVTPMKLIGTLLKLKDDLDNENKEREAIKALMEEIKAIESRVYKEPVVLKTKDLAFEQAKDKELIDFLRQGDIDSIDDFINSYISHENNPILNSTIYCSYFGIKIVAVCVQLIEELGGEAEKVFSDLGSINDYVKKFVDLGKVKNETKKLILSVINYRNKTADTNINLIEKAKHYIERNIAQTKLNLNEVANYVGLSPNHFSYLFKKRTGDNFIRYVTRVRIEKAKELLKTTNMTTAEIAENVGYSDPNYFISVFRRYCGMTTKEFRYKK